MHCVWRILMTKIEVMAYDIACMFGIVIFTEVAVLVDVALGICGIVSFIVYWIMIRWYYYDK